MINVVNYVLWVVLFLASSAAISYNKTQILEILVIGCWANLIFKLVATIILGSTNDLLGDCYLVVHFKAWAWVFGILETIFFGFIVLRLRTVAIQQSRTK